jgi:hypothetical protein
MAGISWIKIEVTLPTKPVVLTLRRLLRKSRNEVVGMLVCLLCWADGVTDDGTLRGLTVDDLDIIVDCEGFGAALLQAGWLTQGEELSFSEWDRHNGQGAKRRATNARCNAEYKHKVSKSRDKGEQEVSKNAHPQNTKCSQSALLDKIRIDKSANALNAGARACEDFSLLDNLREAWPKGAKATAKLKQTWREVLAEGVTPYELMACFERQRLSNQWQQEYPRYVPTLQKWLDERGFKEELRILRAERKKAQESRAERLGEEDYPELSQSDLNSVFD